MYAGINLKMKVGSTKQVLTKTGLRVSGVRERGGSWEGCKTRSTGRSAPIPQRLANHNNQGDAAAHREDHFIHFMYSLRHRFHIRDIRTYI